MRLVLRYTEEFVKRYKELSYGERRLVETALVRLVSAKEPTALSHHLERKAHFCSWSHRVRANLIIVFRVSRRIITFLSTGTHAQAYRPKGSSIGR